MNQPVTTSSDITWAVQSGMRQWDERVKTVIGRLHLCDAYLARINVGDWEQRQEKREWLKTRVGPLVREADPAAVIGDPDRKSTRLNSSHTRPSRMPSSA